MEQRAQPGTMEEFFGPVISRYTRAQAIADGHLVDLSGTKEAKEAGIRFPLAMTLAAYEATVAFGGEWIETEDGSGDSQLVLPGGQSIAGRTWDVVWMLRCAIKRNGPGSHLTFSVLIDEKGNGRGKPVRLSCECGPGDNAEPVLTIGLDT